MRTHYRRWARTGRQEAQQQAARERKQKRRDREAAAGGPQEGNTFARHEKKVGRNDPCPCGSGRKYKRCCGP